MFRRQHGLKWRRIGAAALAAAWALSPALARPAQAFGPYIVTIELTGAGSGTVISTNAQGVADGRINCELLNGTLTGNSDCTETYPDFGGTGVLIYLSATPAIGNCLYVASPDDCFTVDEYSNMYFFTSDLNVGFQFGLRSFNVTVSKSGAGTVSSAPLGIACGATCSAKFSYGTDVTLAALPDPGAYFSGWTGACAGQAAACALTIALTDITTTAVFGLGTPPPNATPVPPTPTKTPGHTKSPPASTAARSTSTPPVVSPAPGDSTLATEPATSGPGSPGTVGPGPSASADPAAAVPVNAPADLSPIALAILGAGLLVAVGLGLGIYSLRRRGPSAS